MKKNTDFANSERRIFISKTGPRLPRHRGYPPLLKPDNARRNVLFVVALVVTLGLAGAYTLATAAALVYRVL